MPWLLKSPGHQQPWYWLCRIGRFLFEEGFQVPASHQWREMTQKCKYMFMFPLKNLARKGLRVQLDTYIWENQTLFIKYKIKDRYIYKMDEHNSYNDNNNCIFYKDDFTLYTKLIPAKDIYVYIQTFVISVTCQLIELKKMQFKIKLSKLSPNERRHYICNMFSHWLRLY